MVFTIMPWKTFRSVRVSAAPGPGRVLQEVARVGEGEGGLDYVTQRHQAAGGVPYVRMGGLEGRVYEP